MKFLNLQKHVTREVRILVRFDILRTRVIGFCFMMRILQRDVVGIFLCYLMQLEVGRLYLNKRVSMFRTMR